MPTATRPTARPLPPRLNGIWIVPAAASAFAAAEFILTLLIGRFFAWGRAEALLFLAFRPWLLLAAAVLAQPYGWRSRFSFYALALLLAGTSETLFLLGLGAADTLSEATRAFAAGAALALVFEAALQIGSLSGGKIGRAAVAGLLALLLAVPGVIRPYERIAFGGTKREEARKPDLMLLSALPLRWGETGPLDPGSRPAAAYTALAREFHIRSLDVLDESSLGTGRLLLLAQPRALSPAELAALDAWVRRGGRALILTDPHLVWPSRLALGDLRRAPAMGLMDPLLQHWGLRMDAPSQPEWVRRHINVRGQKRRLIMFAPGSLLSGKADCEVGPPFHIAQCRIGKGRARILADADMLHDALWLGRGSAGAERHARISDNPLILADWLDELAGIARARKEGAVDWLDEQASRVAACVLALLPILAAAILAAILRHRRRA